LIVSYDSSPQLPGIFTAAVILTIAWGTFAFGAVYPWAYTPLLAACAVLGLAGLFIGRGSRTPASSAWVAVALGLIVAAALLQLLPLPESVLAAVSPAAEPFVTTPYGGAAGGWHPLSIHPAATVRGVVFVAAFSLFLTGLARAFSGRSIVRLARLLVLIGALLALVGIGQKAALGADVWGGMKVYGFWTPQFSLVTPFGPFINKNHYAGWMLLMIPLTLGLMASAFGSSARHLGPGVRRRMLWLSTPDGGSFLLLAFSAFLMTVGLFMTLSRSGISCLLLTVPVMGLVAARRGLTRRVRFVTAALVLLLLMTGAAWAGASETLTRLVQGSDTLQLRLNIWRDALRIARDFPVTGTGLNTFGTATVLYQSSDFGAHYQEAHNDYLQLMAEGGFLVGVPIAITIAVFIRAVLRRFRCDRDDPELYWVRVGAVTGLLAIALQSLVEFSLQMPGIAALFVVVAAIALRASPEDAAHRHRERAAPAHQPLHG
jgi:O-antigen ligase